MYYFTIVNLVTLSLYDLLDPGQTIWLNDKDLTVIIGTLSLKYDLFIDSICLEYTLKKIILSTCLSAT